jgi:hypothetical protein
VELDAARAEVPPRIGGQRASDAVPMTIVPAEAPLEVVVVESAPAAAPSDSA